MFTKIGNITIIYDKERRFISHFYEKMNYKQVEILSKYFASETIRNAISINKNSSGSINLKTGKIHYTGNNVSRIGPIVFNYDTKPEIVTDKPDLYLLELMELVNLQLLNKYGKLLEGKFIETFDVTHNDIGNEIDQILGLSSVHRVRGKINKKMVWKLNESQFSDEKSISSLLKELQFEQLDVVMFQSLINQVASVFSQFNGKKDLSLQLTALGRKLKKYVEIDQWLAST